MRIIPMSQRQACAWLEESCTANPNFDVALAVSEEGNICGVATAAFDGEVFRLVQIQTNTQALVGTLLYGALWRTAKAMGYQTAWL